MLQIIIWLGCLYLVVKALEIASSSVHRNEEGKWNGAAALAVVLAIIGAIGFFLMANAQVEGVSNPFQGASSYDYSDYSSDSGFDAAADADAAAAEVEAAAAEVEAEMERAARELEEAMAE